METSIGITITGLDTAKHLVDGFSERRMNAVVATALTRTAVEAREALYRAMQTDLDRPTSYTLKSLWVESASGNQSNAGTRAIPKGGDVYNSTLARSRFLQASVFLKDDSGTSRNGTPATKYLGPNIYSGGRNVKRFERALQARGSMPSGWQAVPAAGAKLDGNGNVSKGQIIQILSQVGAELTSGYNRGIIGPKDQRKSAQRKRRTALGKAGGEYVAFPTTQGKRKAGIYLAEGRDFGARLGYGRRGNLKPVFLFVKVTNYSRRFDFHGIGQRVAESRLGPNLQQAIAEHRARLASSSS